MFFQAMQQTPQITAPQSGPADDEVVIEPRRGWIGLPWKELYRFRELLFFLVWRDFKVKYKQAVLGVAWSVIVPLLSLLIYTTTQSFIGVGEALKPTTPLIIFSFAGLVPWLFLQRAITDGGNSLLSNQALMTKVYLPRVYLPTASCGNALVDVGINLLLLTAIATFFFFHSGFTPGLHTLMLLPLLVLTFIAGLGTALILSAATVLYRDLRFLIPFIAQFGMWFSGVIIPLQTFKEHAWLFAFNPYAGIVAAFRSAVTGEPFYWLHLSSSVVLSVGMLLFGLFYFRRVERRFADIA
jgi:lipopolysaccharide transport system permease protein